MLFPNLNPVYYADQDASLIERKESFYTQCLMINQLFWSEADTDMRFYSGEQSVLTNYYGQVPVNRRKQFAFNRIRRSIDMVGGHQRRNRKSTIVVPIENASNQTADDFTKVIMWNNNQEGILETISDAFLSSLVTGMSLLHVWLDFRSDPISGNIKVDSKPYNTFLIDPYFRKTDLSDCNGILMRTPITKLSAMSLFPGREDEILGLPSGDWRDGKFNLLPEAYAYGPKNLLMHDEFYYKDFRKATMLIDTQTGETMEWKSEDKEALRYYLQQYPTVTVSEQSIPTVSCDIFLQERVMYSGPNPLGIDKYPFVPVLCYYHPEMPDFAWRVQGMTRGMRDAQYLYNRRRIIELDILESQTTSGFIYKENALVNPADVFMTGQGKGIALKSSAQMTDVQQIQPPQIPQSMTQLSELLAKEVQEISGVNEELLGSAIDDKAGILSMLRQGAGLTLLQKIFDQLDYAQKLLGHIQLETIQNNFAPGKVKTILQREPSPEFYNKNFGRYDCVIEEGMYTSTQKQMQFAQLLQLREAGVPIPDDQLLESATIQNKKELIEAIQKQNEQRSQMEQQQQQVAMQELAARAERSHALAYAETAQGNERNSRVHENIAAAEERKHEAAKEDDVALLNLVKAIKELESVDFDNVHKLITMSQLLKTAETVTTKNIPETPPMLAGQPQQAGQMA